MNHISFALLVLLHQLFQDCDSLHLHVGDFRLLSACDLVGVDLLGEDILSHLLFRLFGLLHDFSELRLFLFISLPIVFDWQIVHKSQFDSLVEVLIKACVDLFVDSGFSPSTLSHLLLGSLSIHLFVTCFLDHLPHHLRMELCEIYREAEIIIGLVVGFLIFIGLGCRWHIV